ncbi:hypothetical protein SPRG_20081 [Saprolegnia parasitica CBS 223.65]|uniref:Uncharacterized protein n=1 Tax=Saprolegnia parasitica (strain CBS 223.65) TaxID=695850 RepID=A0A067CEN9_SAPPC|nr:hypothetical protein SPRG_20081 [Saprolegnia parasitica CBS 223.65]KDO28978.1 hypothetical protein SPRG_20081 [Saprolegnia parasitica CBS 223.65]|eukprot:XP_012200311.1 hypothetical protein SPRG_20081 [Saprolegnia parasitica CBS 223.65]
MESFRGHDPADTMDAPMPQSKLKLRKKAVDDDAGPAPGRKRARREKDVDKAYPDDRSSTGGRDEKPDVVAAPAVGVPFLTASGRDDIEAGKSLLELLLKPSRQKSKRRDDRTEEEMFGTHDMTLVPPGIVNKMDKLKDDYVRAVAAEHTRHWIHMSGFGDSSKFMSNLIPAVEPQYPCNYPTILDEIVVSFMFKRPEYTDVLIRTVIKRHTEHVYPEKNPLVQTMLQKIALLHTGELFGDSAATTRHRIATLAIVKALFHSNQEKLYLSTWILDCLRVTSQDMLEVLVAKLLNAIAFLPLMQPEPQALPWLAMWQDETWSIYDGGHQLVDLVHLETKHDPSTRRVTRAIVREALLRFAYMPQGHFSFFAPAFRSYLCAATTGSLEMLSEVLPKFPPRYAADDPHPVSQLLELFASAIPLANASDNAWFLLHLWPLVLQSDDVASLLPTIFSRYMAYVFGGLDEKTQTDPLGFSANVAFSTVDAWHSLRTFLEAIPKHATKRLATIRTVFRAWKAAWRDAALPLHVMLTMVVVSLSFHATDDACAAFHATRTEFRALTLSLLTAKAATLYASGPGYLAFRHTFLQHPRGLCPKQLANVVDTVLAQLPLNDNTLYALGLQQTLATSLAAELEPLPDVAFFDWQQHVVMALPSGPSCAAYPPQPLLTLHLLTELVTNASLTVATFVQRQVATSPAVYEALIALLSSRDHDVVNATLRLLHDVLTRFHDPVPDLWTQPHVVQAIARLAHRGEMSAATTLLEALVTRGPPRVPLLLLRLCVDALPSLAAHEMRAYVHDVEIGLATTPAAWEQVLQFASAQLLSTASAHWTEKSAAHMGLLVLRMLYKLDWRPEYASVLPFALRTLETSSDVVCALQLGLLYDVVATAPRTEDIAPVLTASNVSSRLQLLLALPQQRGPSIVALARRTLGALETKHPAAAAPSSSL